MKNLIKIKILGLLLLSSALSAQTYEHRGTVVNAGGNISTGNSYISISSIGENMAYSNTSSESYKQINGFGSSILNVNVNISSIEREILTNIYVSANGKEWKNKTGWETNESDLSKWYGIKLDENKRVVEINLVDNNLSGKIPKELLSLAKLKKLYLAKNELVKIPNFSSMSFDTVNISDNRLNFDAIIPVAKMKKINYSNQKPFKLNKHKSIVKTPVGTDILLSSKKSSTLTNSYQWFFRKRALRGATTSQLKIDNIGRAKMGEYKLQVKNRLVPKLTLTSEPVTVLATASIAIKVKNTDGEIVNTDKTAVTILGTIQGRRGYDTIASTRVTEKGVFIFKNVILDNYLISARDDSSKYVPTYYGNTVRWVKSKKLILDKNERIDIILRNKPKKGNGKGKVGGTIDLNFADENGRIYARRRAKRTKCGLRKRRSGGRELEDEWDLFAYGETNDNGEFEYGFIPKGTYQFFVEYPGIPMDESSFVQFEVGEEGTSDSELVLAATVTESGIAVEKVLGLSNASLGINVYPNPTSKYLTFSLGETKTNSINYQLVDLNGKIILEGAVKKDNKLNVQGIEKGVYLLKVFNGVNKKDVFKVVIN